MKKPRAGYGLTIQMIIDPLLIRLLKDIAVKLDINDRLSEKESLPPAPAPNNTPVNIPSDIVDIEWRFRCYFRDLRWRIRRFTSEFRI